MKKIAFVPVRSGSKSILQKNIRSFCGRPLLYWTMEALADSVSFDTIVIASDCEKTKSFVRSWGFENVEVYDRKFENAQDDSSTESVMLEYLNSEKGSQLKSNDLFCLVQATSPLTTSECFQQAVQSLSENEGDSLISVVRTKRFFWAHSGSNFISPENYTLEERPRRQEFDGKLMENGAFYISRVGDIKSSGLRISGKIVAYEMPEYTQVEIDEDYDWIYAESLMWKYRLRKDIKDKNIQVFLSDVDGTLTDGGMYYSENGDELKRFITSDGVGFEKLRKLGIKVGIMTSENTQLNLRRAEKLKLDFCFQGVKDKAEFLKTFCIKEGVELTSVAYVGDDINDIGVLKIVGLAAIPSDAQLDVQKIPNVIKLKSSGGRGVVREFVDEHLAPLMSQKVLKS